MGCRGGELTSGEADILANNKEICDFLRTNWDFYVEWVDKLVGYYVTNEGLMGQTSDVISHFKGVIGSSLAPKTNLTSAIARSRLERDQFISIVAHSVYKSGNDCTPSVKEILSKCRGRRS